MTAAVADAPPGTAVPETTSLVRPLRLGLSIGHPIGPAGSLGPFVILAGGRLGFLSALHVLAPARAKGGDFIHQPSPVDGLPTGETRIAQLVAPPAPAEGGVALGIAAAALLDDVGWLGNVVPEGLVGAGRPIGPPPASLESTPGEPVIVIGRTAGLARGWIGGVSLNPLAVMTPQGPATFFDCLELRGDVPLSGPGDSGALVCRESDLSALAVVFAGGSPGDGPGVTYALPLAPAMAALGASWLQRVG